MIPRTGIGFWILAGCTYAIIYAVVVVAWWLSARQEPQVEVEPPFLECSHCVGASWIDPETLETESFHEFGCPLAASRQLH